MSRFLQLKKIDLVQTNNRRHNDYAYASRFILCGPANIVAVLKMEAGFRRTSTRESNPTRKVVKTTASTKASLEWNGKCRSLTVYTSERIMRMIPLAKENSSLVTGKEHFAHGRGLLIPSSLPRLVLSTVRMTPSSNSFILNVSQSAWKQTKALHAKGL
ncbi:hypothetical protein IV203_032898 [Nitzschia inconspicua]|uniref:Uncharacterized protein n=1 Tax=Nitzschia inconspicua TaxID=303405 RepID=A0A9K3KKI6_9STRA|nr:hypothetical protein IV203_032898 [Nitzschia inconspicua]